MADEKKSAKTRNDQPLTGPWRRATRISGYLSGKAKPIKAVLVNPVIERKRRMKWWWKWVILLPLCAYALSWFVLILIDFFR